MLDPASGNLIRTDGTATIKYNHGYEHYIITSHNIAVKETSVYFTLTESYLTKPNLSGPSKDQVMIIVYDWNS